MENEILIALFTKLIDDRLAARPVLPGPRGQRGRMGSPGEGFDFSEHEETIRAWAKEFALKFEDYTTEQINLLRGPRGEDGRPGRDFVFADHEDLIRTWAKDFALKFEDLDATQISALRGPPGVDGRPGKDFVFEDHESTIRSWAQDHALKFEDLTDAQIAALRGPRGRDGKDGVDGRDFIFTDHSRDITAIIRSAIGDMEDSLKLRFADLTDDDISQLRGPRGRDGRDGRDFIFDEHREYFDSLRLKFSDLTDDERATLKLRFSHLTEDEKASLKLRFKDLTDEDRLLIRGPRGARGQRGITGRDGADGSQGARGLPGPRGILGLTGARGIDGQDGADGADGLDAPTVVAIDVEQRDDDIVFVFKFSDGTDIRSDRVTLPAPVNVFNGGSSGGRGRGVVNYDTRVDEPSGTVTYVGKTFPGTATSAALWQIQKIFVVGTETIIDFADSDAKFDNVWDDRAGLTYG